MRITPLHARFAIGLASLALGACATVIGISPQSLVVTSDPPGARVLMAGADSGVTPVRLALRQRQRTPMMLQLVREGHDTASVVLASHVRKEFVTWDLSYMLLTPILAPLNYGSGGAPSTAGVALLAIAPVGIDVLAGSLWALDRDSVHVVLRAASPSPH